MAIAYNYSTKVITLDAPATMRELWSDSMRVFDDSGQMDDQVPFVSEGDKTQPTLSLVNGWTVAAGSIQYLNTGVLKDFAEDNIWTNVQSVGSIMEGTTLYIEQDGAVVWTAPTTGHINMLLKTKSDGTEINGQAFTVYARQFQNEYSSFATTGGAKIATCPLQTKLNSQLDIAQATIDAYTGMSITWGTVSKDAGDGVGVKTYNIVIDAGGKTLKEAYNWIQNQLLKSTDIDAGAGTKLGNITTELVDFGGTMKTKQGVWIENFAAADANKITYIDVLGAEHNPPVSVPISVASSAGAGATGAQVAVYVLSAPYNVVTYTPSDITQTLLATTLNDSGIASTSLTYTADLNCLVRIRKAGLKPAELGVTLTSAGLSATLVNEVDPVYQ